MALKRPLVVHPFLFAIHPVLFLFVHNIVLIDPNEIILPLLFSLLFTILLYFLLKLVLQDRQKAGILLSISLFLFSSYGYFYHYFHRFNFYIRGYHFGQNKILFSFCLLVYVTLLFLVWKIKDLSKLTRILNFSIGCLVLLLCLQIAVFYFTRPQTTVPVIKRLDNTLPVQNDKPVKRDIYYIILDSYPAAVTLKNVFGFDNEPFLEFLRDNEFFIAERSTSNYNFTNFSLRSSLNMRYLNHYYEGTKHLDEAHEPSIKDNEVMRFLRRQGYRFVHFGSGWGETSKNRYADFDIQCGRPHEFLVILARMSMLRLLRASYNPVTYHSRGAILYTFKRLGRVPFINGPKFVFAHILCPHPPFLFNGEGKPLEDTELEFQGSSWLSKDLYVGQVIFVNNKVKKLVAKLLARSSLSPIIIIQGDHGVSTLHEQEAFSQDKLSSEIFPKEDALKEKCRILNAYHLPDGGNGVLNEHMTPVNSFRAIFNYYFKTNFPLLEERNFHRYQNNFVDVTEQVKYAT